LLHENPDHIKDVNGKLNKHLECKVNDREDEKEKPTPVTPALSLEPSIAAQQATRTPGKINKA
jgi:hypothetical protein